MRLALLTVSLLLLAGCDSNGRSDAPRVFDVTFLDTSGTEVSRAALSFERPAAGESSEGTYRYVSGLRLASSEALRATAEADGPVRVALDLGVSDGGVELAGPFTAGRSDGTWLSGSIVGPVPRGTFRADGR